MPRICVVGDLGWQLHGSERKSRKPMRRPLSSRDVLGLPNPKTAAETIRIGESRKHCAPRCVRRKKIIAVAGIGPDRLLTFGLAPES